MTKTYKIVASLVLALACAGSPCMAKQSPSANSAKKSVVSKKTGKKRSKGRRTINKKRFLTVGRVVFAGLMTSAVAASAYWYFNQDRVSGWLKDIKEKLFSGDAINDGLKELKAADPKKAKELEDKFEQEKTKYATELKKLQDALDAKANDLKKAEDAKKNALNQVADLDSKLQVAVDNGSVETVSLKKQLEEQKKLVTKWSNDCTTNAVDITKFEGEKRELNQKFETKSQELENKTNEFNKVVKEKTQLKTEYDNLMIDKEKLQKTVDNSKDAKRLQELEIENKQLRKLTKPGPVKKISNKVIDWVKHLGDDDEEEKIQPDPKEKKLVEEKA